MLVSIIFGLRKIFIVKDFIIINMNWKEFFKPKWYKILIALILFVFLFFGISLFDTCFGGRLCPSGTVNYHPPLSCHFYSDCIPESQATFLNIVQRGPIYLLSIMISYTLACLIFIKSALKKNNI